MKAEKQLDQLQSDVSKLQRKVSALTNLVYGRLETAETNAESKLFETNMVAKGLYEEAAEDFYLIATIVSDIGKSIEHMQIENA